MYLILECGRVGLDLAEQLSRQKEDVMFLIEDENNIEKLKAEGYNASTGDIGGLSPLERSNISCVLILGENPKKNEELAESTGTQLPNIPIIALAFDPEGKKRIEKIDNAHAVYERGVVLSNLLGKAHEFQRKSYSVMIKKMLKGAKNEVVGIFLHNDPDPDALASALAFQRLCEKEGCSSKIFYGGEISRPENKELVKLLELELHHIESVEDCKGRIKEGLSRIIMIETTFPSENNMLPKDVIPHVVIDHHSSDKNVEAIEFVDIRAHIGAASTMMIEYLQELDVKMDTKLATALLYGIRTDTNGLIRNISTADLRAVAFLSPFIDKEMLKTIESPKMNPETLDIIGRAMMNRERMNQAVFSFVGYIEDRDALPQAGEFILREEDVSAVAICGIRRDNVYVSARSSGTSVLIDKVIKEAYGKIGSAGGHDTSAGAQIPLDKIHMGDKSDKELVADIVSNMTKKLFFNAMGIDIPSKTV